MTHEQVRIIDEIAAERQRQIRLCPGGDTNEFDKSNTRNDWVAFMLANALGVCVGNMKDPCSNAGFRRNMVKLGALVVAAVEAIDNGYIMEGGEPPLLPAPLARGGQS